MKSQIFTKTLLLATAFACTSLNATQALDDMAHAKLYITNIVVQVTGKTVRDYDKWQDNYERSCRDYGEAAGYIERRAKIDPEEAAWLLAGGKHGLHQANLNSDQKRCLSTARSIIITKETEYIKANQPGFLRNIHSNDLNSQRVIKIIYDEINRLTGRVTVLESSVTLLNARVAKLEDDNKGFIAKITKLENDNKTAYAQILNLEKEKVEKTTTINLNKNFADLLKTETINLNKNFADLLKTEREANENKLNDEKRDRIAAQEKAIAAQEKADVSEKKLEYVTQIAGLEKDKIEFQIELKYIKRDFEKSEGKNKELENQIIDLKAQILRRDNVIDDLNKKIADLVVINFLNQ
jgi:chromosome segregation ATPase